METKATQTIHKKYNEASAGSTKRKQHKLETYKRTSSGDKWNDRADELADEGRKQGEVSTTEDHELNAQEELYPRWEPKTIKHREEKLKTKSGGEVARVIRAATELGRLNLPPRSKGYEKKELDYAKQETTNEIKKDTLSTRENKERATNIVQQAHTKISNIKMQRLELRKSHRKECTRSINMKINATAALLVRMEDADLQLKIDNINRTLQKLSREQKTHHPNLEIRYGEKDRTKALREAGHITGGSELSNPLHNPLQWEEEIKAKIMLTNCAEVSIQHYKKSSNSTEPKQDVDRGIQYLERYAKAHGKNSTQSARTIQEYLRSERETRNIETLIKICNNHDYKVLCIHSNKLLIELKHSETSSQMLEHIKSGIREYNDSDVNI